MPSVERRRRRHQREGWAGLTSAPAELDFVDIEWVRSTPTMSFPSLVEVGGEGGWGVGGWGGGGGESSEERKGEENKVEGGTWGVPVSELESAIWLYFNSVSAHEIIPSVCNGSSSGVNGATVILFKEPTSFCFRNLFHLYIFYRSLRVRVKQMS